MWGLSFVPLIITAFILQYFPDKVPMHYDMAGNIDRWGNKAEQLTFPILIIGITGFWYLLIRYYERKAVKARTEKEKSEAESNAKVLQIVSISQIVMFGIMHFFILYGAFIEANAGLAHARFDIGKISCVLLGILFIVLGNVMPKTRNNHTLGVRTKWSMYNDTTWKKTNHFGAVCLMIAGLLTVITSVLLSEFFSVILMMFYLIMTAILVSIYSWNIYKKEIQ